MTDSNDKLENTCIGQFFQDVCLQQCSLIREVSMTI